MELLIFIPLALATAALALPSNRLRPWFLPVGSVLHLALTVAILSGGWGRPAAPAPGAWLALDGPGRLVLALVSVLFCVSSFYAVGYLHHREERSNRVFCACVLGLLGVASMVAASQHLGLLWVAVEATSLCTAPLIYFNHNRRSIEATWKYLLICSVGIALSLLGTFFLAYASLKQGLEPSLLFDDLAREARSLSAPWFHGAFVLLLVGYGTKMGLAPMHTWKPDAYGEAPGMVGGLLAGAVTSCAFLALLRIYRIAIAAGAGYAQGMLLTLGLISMGVAGVFVLRQRDFKRMLAYSSVEHMGILALGLGLGGLAIPATLFHLVNNGLAKGLMFLTAGNIHRAYGSKFTDDVSGSRLRLPLSGWLFLFGLLAVTGSPPFGPFQSLFGILNAAVGQGRILVACLAVAFLLLVFLGMGKTVLAVFQGVPSEKAEAMPYRDGLLTGLPIVVLFGLVLLLGLYLPAPLRTLLSDAAAYVEAGF